MNHRHTRFASLILVGTLFACADSTTNDPAGGETHFLHACDDSDSCGLGLDCICGFCSKPCLSDNSCKTSSALATCELAGTPNGACVNPQASPVCDVECNANADCNSLGAGYTCEQGSCRKLSAGACISDGVIYAEGAVFMVDCNACTCSDGTLACDDQVCSDSGMDAGRDSGNMDIDARTGDVDARTVDADVDAGPILVDTGLVAAADLGCDSDAGAGVFTPKDMDPVPTCVELDDLTAIPGSEMLAFTAEGIQTSTQSDTDIFWVIGSSAYRVSKSGGDPLQFGHFGDARSLMVDGCHLYLASADFSGVLGSKSLADGSDRTLAQFPDAGLTSDIVADDDHFYLFMDTTLQRVPRSGGSIVTMARRQADSIAGYDAPVLTASDTDLYWLDGASVDGTRADRVMTMPKDGQTRPRVLVAGLPQPGHVRWINGFLYVLNFGNRDSLGNYVDGGGLIRIDPTNGDTLTLATFAGAIDLASDDSYLYWIQAASTGLVYSVSRVPLDQSESPEVLFASLRGNGRGLMVDDANLYWQSECWGDGFSSAFIVRVPKPAPP